MRASSGWGVRLLSALCAGSLLAAVNVQAVEYGVASESGRYRASFESRLTPITINVIHAWVVQLTSASGEAIDDAEITVTGGMPLHNHGLSTAPRVTEKYGDGRYLVEGFRFHMGGTWLVTLAIEHATGADLVIFELEI